MPTVSRRRLFQLTGAGLCASRFVSPVCAEEKAGMSPASEPQRNDVLPGIDVLEQQGFAPLVGQRVGLLTHKAGLTRNGRRSIDVLAAAAGVKLVTLFSPEHGLGADREGEIGGARDAKTKLAVASLYGASKRPTPEMLQGLDVIVIDLQDVGVRFYTYATTMAYLMEEAAKAGVKVIVLDRPNPIAASGVAGPVLDKDLKSFVGYFEMPILHGMTLAELARMFNVENAIAADLDVVPMRSYVRQSWYDETGLAWTSPSPNLRRLGATVLYPGLGFLEFANLSVGRGTPAPFEYFGAPWIDATALLRALERRKLPGLRLARAEFTPNASKFAGETCFGLRITIADRAAVDAVGLGIEIAVALRRLHPDIFEHRALAQLLGSRAALRQIEAGAPAADIIAGWQPGLAAFREVRARHLLY